MSSQNEDIGPRLMAAQLTLSIIAFFFVLVRSFTRIRDRNYGSDDVCSALAEIFFLIIAASVSWSAVRGCYKPKDQLSLGQIELGIKIDTLCQVYISFGAAFGKIAIALLQIRILAQTFIWKRVVLWAIIAITVVFTIFTSCVSLFQCNDPKAAWDLPLRAHTHCWSASSVSLQATITASWYTAADFILALFPIVLLWDIHVPFNRKMAILILLGLGIITGVFSALKTSLLPTLSKNTADVGAQFRLQIFATLELFFLIVLGCVPVMKKPWLSMVDRLQSNSMLSSVRRLLSPRSSKRSDKSGSDYSSEMATSFGHDSMAMDHFKGDTAADVESWQR